MAFLKSKNDKDEYYSDGYYSDGYYSNGYSDEKFELDPAALDAIAGGAGQGEYFDTYRYWRDQNGVLREIR
jgi:hypothetical protein